MVDRRLMSIYHILHSSVHAKNSHLKVQHCVSRDSISLAWVTPSFELYCVAGSSASRNALAQSASAVVRWARKEEGRIFIIGGAVWSFVYPDCCGLTRKLGFLNNCTPMIYFELLKRSESLILGSSVQKGCQSQFPRRTENVTCGIIFEKPLSEFYNPRTS